MLTTYPALEIGLMLGFTVGVVVVFPLLVLFLVCLYHCIDYCIEVFVRWAKECENAIAGGVCAGSKKLRQRNGENIGDPDSRAQLPDPLPHQDRGYAAVPPPAYSAV